MSARRLDASELEGRLEALVFNVLNSRRSIVPAAHDLAAFAADAQQRFLAAIEQIARTSIELAYNFVVFAVPSLARVDPGDWDDWVLHLLNRYDQSGVMACIVEMRRVGEYVAARRATRDSLRLAEVAGVIEHFVCGLGGRPLRLVAGAEAPWTDTETLYLPEQVRHSARREDNYRLYKAMAVHLWAQTWYGTWRQGLREAVAAFDSPGRAVALFHALETARLSACLGRDLPGVDREMRAYEPEQRESPAVWRDALAELRGAAANVEASLAWLGRVYGSGWAPEPTSYQGVLRPDRTEEAIALRQARERRALQDALASFLPVPPEQATGEAQGGGEAAVERFEAATVAAPERPEGLRMELRLHGEPLPPVQEVTQLLDSIVQDFGFVPEEYLVAAGPGRYQAGASAGAVRDDQAAGEATFLYDEWDHARRHYRKEWCVLRERNVHPVPDDFVPRTIAKHRGLLRHLYRTFEALRGEDRVLKRQPFGDDVDIDAVVQAWADRRVGLEGTDRLFSRRSREERDIAVMFMVDMSGSTKGWINDMEREALVLLCQSLELLGDRYAIYGFSGFTHKRCELLRIKGFDEPYGEAVQARISGIRPLDYTRMGVAIRHLTWLLNQVEARTRLLVTLSDGRPDDQDGYRGLYGIEDTRQALIEARHTGVHPFCITIDDEALEYLPHMYGPASFTVVSQVEKLPFRVSDIYRRITRR